MVARVKINGSWQPMLQARRALRIFNHPGHSSQKSHGRARGGVRQALAKAGTTQEVAGIAAAEAKRITGRDIPFDYGDIDPQLAREYSEGVLRGLERFPDAPLGAVRATEFPPERGEDTYTWAHALSPDHAPTASGQYEIEFNNNNQASGEILEMSQRRGLKVYGDPAGLALHEFGHVMHESRGTAGRAARTIRQWADEKIRANRPPPARKGLFRREEAPEPISSQERRITIMRELSSYAANNDHEAAAEAFADVMINGSGASPLSAEIMGQLEGAAG